MKNYGIITTGAVSMLILSGCFSSHTIESTHEIKPVEIKPIHITIDVNVKVDKDLDDFFGDIDKKASKQAPPAPAAADPKTEKVPAAPVTDSQSVNAGEAKSEAMSNTDSSDNSSCAACAAPEASATTDNKQN